MSRGSSGGKQVVQFANAEIAVEFVYSGQGEMKKVLPHKDYYCKLWLGGCPHSK